MKAKQTKAVSDSLSSSSFIHSGEQKHQVIEDIGYEDVLDIFGSSMHIYMESCQNDDKLLIRLWMAQMKWTAHQV